MTIHLHRQPQALRKPLLDIGDIQRNAQGRHVNLGIRIPRHELAHLRFNRLRQGVVANWDCGDDSRNVVLVLADVFAVGVGVTRNGIS